MNKSRKNMEETGWASVSAYDMSIHKAYQIKGTVEIKSEGPEYEKGKMREKNLRGTGNAAASQRGSNHLS